MISKLFLSFLTDSGIALSLNGISAPFFYTELVLSSTKYAISIENGQNLFGSIDTLCINKKYFIFNVLSKPIDHMVTLTIIKISPLHEGDSIYLSYYFASNHDTLPCDSSVVINGFYNKNLLNDTTVILWEYGLPLRKATSYRQPLSISQPHIHILLKNGNDSSYVTLTKGPYPYMSALQRNKIYSTQNNVTSSSITTISFLRAIAAHGKRIIFFDVCGEKLFDSNRDNFFDGRLSGKVLLYKIESGAIPPVWGKIIAP